jgi:hypothetical protein
LGSGYGVSRCSIHEVGQSYSRTLLPHFGYCLSCSSLISRHVHLHVISSDRISPALKTKKHYNSFRTDLAFFVHLSDVEKWIQSDRYIVCSSSTLRLKYKLMLADTADRRDTQDFSRLRDMWPDVPEYARIEDSFGTRMGGREEESIERVIQCFWYLGLLDYHHVCIVRYFDCPPLQEQFPSHGNRNRLHL